MEHRRSRLGGSCGQPTGGCPSPVRTGRHVPPPLLVCGSRWCHHFQPEQIGEQDDGFAVRAAASQPYRASIQMTVRAATLAKEALATARTLVDRVRHEHSLALELLAEDDRIQVSSGW